MGDDILYCALTASEFHSRGVCFKWISVFGFIRVTFKIALTLHKTAINALEIFHDGLDYFFGKDCEIFVFILLKVSAYEGTHDMPRHKYADVIWTEMTNRWMLSFLLNEKIIHLKMVCPDFWSHVCVCLLFQTMFHSFHIINY